MSKKAATNEADGVFIRHIQSHLAEGQEVVCKICGESAKDIIGQNAKVFVALKLLEVN